MSFWIAGKYPDLVSSASNFMGSSEFVVGPRAFPAEYRHDEMAANYAGVRTRLVTGTQDFIQFYHRQMNQICGACPPTKPKISTSPTARLACRRRWQFHMNAFAKPLPRPEHAGATPTSIPPSPSGIGPSRPIAPAPASPLLKASPPPAFIP